MKNHKISFIEELPEEIQEKAEQGLTEYEISHQINVNYQPFALVLTDEKNDVMGVLSAFTSYSSIHIDDMWVDKDHRGKGYGKALLAELENRFKDKGLNNINLVSCAFQAPEFYKKCGFKTEFVRENVKNPKLTMTFFVKFFNE